MPRTQQEILSMTRDVQMGNDIYMVLLNKQHELNINKASTLGNVRIIDNAVTQHKPIKPKNVYCHPVGAVGLPVRLGCDSATQHVN